MLLDPCIPNMCPSGDICNRNGSGGFTCTDPCHSNPCQNTGRCKKTGNGGYYCNCTFTSYFGSYCELGLLFFPITLENMYLCGKAPSCNLFY